MFENRQIYTKADVMNFIEEEDVKFIKLAFCDVFGIQKNVSILSGELEKAFDDGILFDASAIRGFGSVEKSDLLLFPDPSTITILPWRPSRGRVVRLYCDIRYPDGTSFEADTRNILKDACELAKSKNLKCNIGTEFEFYLFKTDQDGNPTNIPFDNAGYMDIAPDDKGENVRRDICLTLEEMGISPESSHHEEGPGQNEIDFLYSDPLTAADNAETFKTVVKTISAINGLYASFSPKPLENHSGNGLHINMSIKTGNSDKDTKHFMAGVMEHIDEITLFLNPMHDSYKRLGQKKAPKYITWSKENRSQLIRIPAAKKDNKRFELRSPDPSANPYLAYALLLLAGIDGIERELELSESVDVNLFDAGENITAKLKKLPESLEEAYEKAKNSEFVNKVITKKIVDVYSFAL